MSRTSSLRLYVISRLLLAPLMIWTITTVVFLLMRATPGDPIDAILGPRAPEAAKALMRTQLGLDQSLPKQYLDYLGQLLTFDLGSSITTQGLSVWQIIGAHFPATVELSMCGLVIAAVVGLTVGSIAASRPNTWFDTGGRLFGIVTYAIPMYWFGILLQLLFAVQLGWFPTGTRFPFTAVAPDGPTGLYLL
ncbi:MAG: ABC transporter permease, partial [Cyanobacteria bacterium J06554_3]